MPLIISLCILAAGLASAETTGPVRDIVLEGVTLGSNVQIEKAFDGAPDAGVLRRYNVRLPRFEAATYFAAYQRHDPLNRQNVDSWPDGTNRVQPLPVRDFHDLKEGGIFVLLKVNASRYMAVLPLTGKNTVAWFASGSASELTLKVGTLGTGRVHGDLPLIAYAVANDPYDASRMAWETAIRHPLIDGSTRLRADKRYPEILRYLGWCSWEEYKVKIDEPTLLGAIDHIEKSGLPIRWLLVDDGHLTVANRQLVAFDPDPAKFPHGWAPILARRNPEHIRWMGLWLNFNGYWNGVSPENRMGELNQHLEAVPSAKLSKGSKALEPKDSLEDSMAFYDAMVATNRRAGFDFIKVDNQAKNLVLYRGTEQPVEAAVANSNALEMAAAFHMDALINCMAHGPVNIFNTRVSAVTRCSEDYKLGDLPRAKRHLHNSYGNMIWLGQTVWGDHDMFHSDDPVAGRMMAVSKAISGGPVYLSDNPEKFTVENIRPLTLGDGQLLPVLAPATLLPESLFVDPLDEKKPLRAVAPLPGQAAAIVVYNLTEPESEVTGYVEPDDYRHANGLMQPRGGEWRIPGDGLVLYDWYAKRAAPLAARYTFAMPKFSDRLLLLCPVRGGWGVIGRTDKYLSPAAVETVSATANELVLKVGEPGPVTIWHKDGKATLGSKDCKVRKLADHLWQADVAATARITKE